ncbi:hypothetical protein PVA44_06400 [Entomospira nematocerorum]|uniref:Lipoprotein n=1 Tax=Entomospira nematocerorum TaxID=2719987 RepID=A0A968GDT1_9SPIO|nr:DUF6675 family protein [Entomospira nematocera]NIZ46348.1 hypothetical protein [Entomospira nematocera]WDI33847.1 hypothetical protein PVA44_06400 [Entomospira nematocera]
MKKIWFGLSLLLGCSVSIFSQSLRDVVTASSLEQLLKKGYVFNEDSRIDVHHTMAGIAHDTIKRHINELDANFSLEFLYFIPKDQLPTRKSSEILKQILQIESLKTAYMMRNNGKEQPLFKQVEVLNNFKDRKKVNVQIEEPISIPFQSELFISLKDSRFGKIDYQVNYLASNELVLVSLLNFTPLSYMGKKIAQAHSMRLSFMEQVVDEGTLFVGHVVGNISDLEKAKKSIHLPSFFSRRVEGIKGWYFNQVYDMKIPQGVYPVAVANVHAK